MTDAVPHVRPLPWFKVEDAMSDMLDEIDRQDELARAGKFGGRHTMPGGTDLERLAVLAEEFGEVAIELNEAPEGGRTDNLRTELVQVAAVAIAWVAAIDDRRAP